MTSFYFLIDLLVFGCGVYVIWQYVHMIRTREISSSMLPKDIPATRCKDVDGYISEVGTRMLVFGITATICGIVDLAQDILGYDNIIFSLIVMAVFLVVCFWFGFASRNAMKKYFN